MSIYRTVLVPLDGSERAEVILPHVEELAERYEAQVVLLHVIEFVKNMPNVPDAAFAFSHDIVEQRAVEARAYLAALEERFREKGIAVRTRVEIGSVVETIISIAKEENADLIAMASHGRTGLSQVFYGSVAAGVLHRIDRPLLLIRS